MTNSTALQQIRFAPELEMQGLIIERFGLTESAALVPIAEREKYARLQQSARSFSVRLTQAMAPALIELVEQTFETLGLDPHVELLISPTLDINACAYGTIDDTTQQLIEVTAGAVKHLSETQLRFVIGHEVGHNAFLHQAFQDDINMIYRNEGTPELLDSRLRVLRRLQEISADRAGILAVGGDLETATSALLRMETGLGPEFIKLDLSSLKKEVERIANFDIPDMLFSTAHPLLPLRMRALQLFVEGGDNDDILRVSRLMDYEARDLVMVNERNFILAGGLITAHMDGDDELSESEREHLVGLLLPFSDDPEALLSGLETADQASDLLISSGEWLANNIGPERYEIMQKLISVALQDDIATEGEMEFLGNAGSLLQIPFNWIEKQVFEHGERTARRMGAPRAFGLSGW